MKSTDAFTQAYAGLNQEQKQAVDTVEGPVMVLAGPGTGKTSILTLRVANILAKTDAKPDEILVLTFTDSAARTVAKRLARYIGEETARKVGVFTFHSFAEHLLKEHPEAFPDYLDRRQMGEVEHTLLWRAVLENTSTETLSTPKFPFHYLKALKQLEDTMTREKLSLEEYLAWLLQEEKAIEADPSLRYVRGGKSGAAGDLKPDGLKRLERVEKGRAAVESIKAYRAERDARGLYGYTDTLRIAVEGITEDDALRAELQEKYQYVLADEHQDANALQHALIDALAFDDQPNLFIVGDEKQAVFGFQGADTTHFKTFLELYPKTKVVTLAENYRSHQEILDVSHGLLAELPSSTGGHTALTAARGTGGSIHLLASPDPLAERDQIATLVEEAIAEGVAPHEIAVITLKNKTADLFALALRARGIPTLRAGDIDLEGRPGVRFLLSFMRAIADPNDRASLRESLLAPWWEASIAHRAAFMRQHSDRDFSEALADTFPDIAKLVHTLQEQALQVPPVNVLSLILKNSGARAFFLSNPEGISEDIPMIRQLILHIEDIVRKDPNATFGEVMEQFANAREHEIGSIKTSLTQREGHVTVITAHKAKGMEFERVYVTALTAREWEGRGAAALIPSPFDTKREKEELVRLFYVALTRAKNALILSYAVEGAEGKEQAPISLLPPGLSTIDVLVDPLPLMHESIKAPALVRELTERYLVHDGLSPSAYNEYLESPAAFFAKRVLRLREPENRAIVVGNAVHAAIATYLRAEDKDTEERAAAAHAELTRRVKQSLLPRGDTFEALLRHGHTLLDTLLAGETLTKKALAIEESFRLERSFEGKEIILKGSVDAVFPGTEGECIVDFKTSSQVQKKDKEKFERQIAFYDLLLSANGHEPTSGLIIQITEEKIAEHPVVLNTETRAELKTTLDTVLTELLSGEWRTGEPSEYDALLDLFKD